MFGEVAIFGVFVPKLLVLAFLAFVFHSAGTRILTRANIYRIVWHPALFNLSLFVVIFTITAAVFQRYAS